MYTQFKDWFERNRQKIIYAASCLLIFFIGFGTGRGEQSLRKRETSPPPPSQLNNTTHKAEVTEEAPKPPEVQPAGATLGAIAPPAGTDCRIKGNISSSGKIYHVPEGSFYARTNPEQCFATEAEAQAAGFRKSSR